MAYDHSLHSFKKPEFNKALHTYEPSYNRNPPADEYVKETNYYSEWGHEAKVRTEYCGGNVTYIINKELDVGQLINIEIYIKIIPEIIKIKLFKKTPTHFLFIKEKSFYCTKNKMSLKWDIPIESNYYISFYRTLAAPSSTLSRKSTGEELYYNASNVTTDILISDLNLLNKDISLNTRTLYKTVQEVK